MISARRAFGYAKLGTENALPSSATYPDSLKSRVRR